MSPLPQDALPLDKRAVSLSQKTILCYNSGTRFLKDRVQWYTSETPARGGGGPQAQGRLLEMFWLERLGYREFKASLGYVRPCLKIKQTLPPPQKKNLQVPKMMLRCWAEIRKLSTVFNSFMHSLYDLNGFHDDCGIQ